MTVLRDKNGNELEIRATVFARIEFEQQFGKCFEEQVNIFFNTQTEETEVFEILSKFLWAMNKAECAYKKQSLPGYKQWLSANSGFCVDDCINEFLEEFRKGFLIENSHGYKDDGGEDFEIMSSKIIAVALRVGMSLDDLNQLSMQSIIDLFHEMTGKAKEKNNKSRKATGKEASAFFM